ncbi:hypothetical protein OPV22_025027 [Ensete ventricosum]|uniref:Uncharacterized protein n=1 Tax=Ensete ventricosum TaxID=4639 RepID=A0AAV8Q2Q9_ENSVE|nr:hypothetical protein OPV22_025027 [Ensete ventricosum]
MALTFFLLASADRTKWSFHVPILVILLLSRKALLCQIVEA